MILIDELAEAYLNGDDYISYVFNRKTKEIIPELEDELTGESEIDWDGEDAAFFVRIPQLTSSEAYDLMMRFATTQSEEISRLLIDALNRKKPFRSFKAEIQGQGIENDWYDYENDFAKRKMLVFLKENE